MADHRNTDQIQQEAALRATAEQLDIAGEDVAVALEEVLETFEQTAAELEGLEARLAEQGELAPSSEQVLADVKAIRGRLRAAVVSLQFEDRLSQRLGLAARELRAQCKDIPDASGKPEPVLTSTVHSLYARSQIRRILGAAGFQPGDTADDKDGGKPDAGDSVELF